MQPTYKRESAAEIARRIREGEPGTPVFTSEAKPVEGKTISSIGAGR
jgi:hypothetical protein